MNLSAPFDRQRSFFAEWLYLLAALATLASYIGYFKFQDYVLIEFQERERLVSQTQVIEQNLVRQIVATGRAIDDILHRIPSWRQQHTGLEQANQQLTVLAEALDGVRNILILDAAGRVFASNNRKFIGDDLSRREFFLAASKEPSPHTLYVTPPFRTTRGDYVMSLIRIIPGPRGEFDGLVVAGVDPEYFNTLLDSVRYAPDMRTSVIHGDGKLFMTVPARADLSGHDMATPDSLFTRHRNSGRSLSVFANAAHITDEERIVALRTIQPAGLFMDKSLVVSVSRDSQAIFNFWYRGLKTAAWIFAVMALAAILSLFLYQRRRRIFDLLVHNYELGRQRAESELRVAAAAFESQEGIIITDAHSVILRVNRAFTEITGFTAEEAVGQTPRLLKSGRHDARFYAEMWQSINRAGSWHGEVWDRRKNGEIYPSLMTITAVKSDDGTVTHYVGTHTDITARKLAEDEIRSLAFYDPLTQLPNRRLLLDRLGRALASSARSGRHGGLLFLDLDNFKMLNDSFGHDQGDMLLQQVAQRLATCVREGDTAARLGGDEFVVMLEDLSENREEAAAQTQIVGEKILATLNQVYRLDGREHHSTPSIGATLFSGHQTTIEEILKQADLAMYQSKSAGRNTLRFFALATDLSQIR